MVSLHHSAFTAAKFLCSWFDVILFNHHEDILVDSALKLNYKSVFLTLVVINIFHYGDYICISFLFVMVLFLKLPLLYIQFILKFTNRYDVRFLRDPMFFEKLSKTYLTNEEAEFESELDKERYADLKYDREEEDDDHRSRGKV